MLENFRIHTLVPDLPPNEAVIPYLEEMDSSRWYSNFGPLVQRFEAQIPSVLAPKGRPARNDLHIVTLSSATAALELAIRAFGFPSGSKVLVPALTFPATALAVVNAGLEPVICDVNAFSLELCPVTASEAVASNSEIVLVVPVATYGKPVPEDQWETFQAETGVQVLFDCAAAFGQQSVSSRLPFVFSLHATKPMGVGEGGLLVTPDTALAARVRELSNFGFSSSGTGLIEYVGTNAKMGEYYAAVGLAQLTRFPEIIARREKIKGLYVDAFSDLSATGKIAFQDGFEEFVPAVFCIRTEGHSMGLMEHFRKNRIQTRRWYLPPLHLHPAFRAYSCVDNAGKMVNSEDRVLPASDSANQDVIGLPFHAFLGEADIAEIVDCLVKGLEQ